MKRNFWPKSVSKKFHFRFQMKLTSTKQSQFPPKTKQNSCAKNTHICLGANFDDFASCGRILLTIQLHLRTTESDINCIATDVFRSFALIIKADMLTTDSTSMIYFLFVTQCFHYLRSLHPFRKCARTFIVLWCRRDFEWERAHERTPFSKKCVSSKFAICSVERLRRDVRASRALNDWAKWFWRSRSPLGRIHDKLKACV